MMNRSQPKWLIGVSAVAAAGGLFLIVTGMRKADRSTRLPRMTCDDLAQNGPGANQFVTLADVHLCAAGDAFRRDVDGAMEMYIPIYSNRRIQEPAPGDLALVLEVLDDRDREALLANPKVGELNVEFWAPAGQFDPWVRDRLGQIYPGILLAKCRVLSVGLHEPSVVHARSEMMEGVILIVFAFVIQLGWWVWSRVASPRTSVSACN
jgi:hypothetical protein